MLQIQDAPPDSHLDIIIEEYLSLSKVDLEHIQCIEKNGVHIHRALKTQAQLNWDQK